MSIDDWTNLPDLSQAVKQCTDGRKSNMFTYSGSIYSNQVNRFLAFILQKKRYNKLCLILTTYGGDAHAAYRLARSLQSLFSKIRLIVVGPCKSAGTLVSICANELVFGPFGELGPLDIQITKKDDLMSVGSGLDTFQALAILQNQTFIAFEAYMLELLERSQGALSTKTACEIASQLATGLFSPLTAQLDPQRMGEMQRMMTIAKAYGERLGLHNLKDGALTRLVEEYPAHSFIIDVKEARSLFKEVSTVSPAEFVVLKTLEEAGGCILAPDDDIIFRDVSELSSEGGGGKNAAETKGGAQDTESHDAGEPRDARPQQGDGQGPNGASGGKRRRKQAVAAV